MEVRLPGNLKLNTGLYLAVDRQLTAVFAVKYNASENVDWALRMLRRSHITPILAARDPNVTPALLKRKFSRKVKVSFPKLADRAGAERRRSGTSGMPTGAAAAGGACCPMRRRWRAASGWSRRTARHGDFPAGKRCRCAAGLLPDLFGKLFPDAAR
jgi:hypothetical protein